MKLFKTNEVNKIDTTNIINEEDDRIKAEYRKSYTLTLGLYGVTFASATASIALSMLSKKYRTYALACLAGGFITYALGAGQHRKFMALSDQRTETITAELRAIVDELNNRNSSK